MARHEPLAQPVGLKLELTHRCNLRCGFCYTDSPRRTLEGTLDMSDEEWRGVVEQAIELGVIEAVITGGEPLLRKDLTLELIERLDHTGVAVSLNTNGWFVDESVADRIAAARGVRVHVSIDGASPEVHDTARGVPGSWRRAIRAVDLLLSRGVSVQAIHVVSPANEDTIDECLEQLWMLGVRSVGISTVVPIGAASRERGWIVGRRSMDRAIKDFRRRHGRDMAFVTLAALESLPSREDRPPAALLVRPNGTVMIDSIHPFSFGSVEDGLATCWDRVLSGWRDPRITDWADGLGRVKSMADSSLVPYRDEPLPIAGRPHPTVAGRRRKAGDLEGPPPRVAASDLDEARQELTELALRRRYRGAKVRWAGGETGERYVRVLDQRSTFRVNGTVGLVMDACAGGTPHDAVERLRGRHPSIPRERIARDTVRAVRWLTLNGLLRPGAAPH
jgi:MoaA/NifB/PqqE/SkfB family radical SAM enzyme